MYSLITPVSIPFLLSPRFPDSNKLHLFPPYVDLVGTRYWVGVAFDQSIVKPGLHFFRWIPTEKHTSFMRQVTWHAYAAMSGHTHHGQCDTCDPSDQSHSQTIPSRKFIGSGNETKQGQSRVKSQNDKSSILCYPRQSLVHLHANVAAHNRRSLETLQNLVI